MNYVFIFIKNNITLIKVRLYEMFINKKLTV